MTGYMAEMRKLVGHRTIIQCAASIICIDGQGRVLLGKRRDNHKWGYSGGSIEIDEYVEDCAKRELQEETGLIAKKLFFMFKMYSSVGFCNELVNIFMADNFLIGKQNFDEDEFISLEEYNLSEAKKLIHEGKITDGKTIAAVFAYDSFKDKFKQ